MRKTTHISSFLLNCQLMAKSEFSKVAAFESSLTVRASDKPSYVSTSALTRRGSGAKWLAGENPHQTAVSTCHKAFDCSRSKAGESVSPTQKPTPAAKGVVVRKKKKLKIYSFFFCVMHHATMAFSKRSQKIFFAPAPPLLQKCQNRGNDAVFVPLRGAPPSVSHAPFCTLLCFQRMMNHGPCIRASKSVTILDISIEMLMCRKSEKRASSQHLIAGPLVIQIWLLVVGKKRANPWVEGLSWVFMHYYRDEMTKQHFTCHGDYYGRFWENAVQSFVHRQILEP